jgi:ubiquinone/menaquinone biosynthesis C-methylase UbiE
MLKKAQNKAEIAKAKNIQFLQSNGKNIQIDNNAIDLVLLVTVYHEVGESEAVLK